MLEQNLDELVKDTDLSKVYSLKFKSYIQSSVSFHLLEVQ